LNSQALVSRSFGAPSHGRRARPLFALLAALYAIGSACGGENSAHAQSATVWVDNLAPLYVRGEPAGPFTPPARTFTLHNDTAQPRAWSAAADSDWIDVSPASGELAAGATLEVRAAVDAEAVAKLGAGERSCQIEFLDVAAATKSNVRVFLLAARDGWTEFPPSPDTRTVYVSSSAGDDSNNGRTEATPKRSIAAGVALLRHGFPDRLLLKRGDAWDERFGQWKRSGRSAAEPMVISSYGDSGARPLLRSGDKDGVIALVAGDSPPRIDYLAFVGLHLHADKYTGEGSPSGFAWLLESTGLTIEDCLIEGYEVDVLLTEYGGRKRDVAIRRNVIVDAFATKGTVGHGIYLSSCDRVLIEGNVIDRNGWNPKIPGADPSIYRHGIYVQSGGGRCNDVIVRGNIISNSASHGLQMRSGGVVEDNLFLRNSIALQLGGGNEPEPGGVHAVALNNVILGGKNIDAANPRGWGILAENIASAAIVGNIVTQRADGDFAAPLSLAGDKNGVGVFHTLLEGNIVRGWGGSLSIGGRPDQLGPLYVRGNTIHNALSNAPMIDLRDASSVGALHASGNRYFSASAAPSAWFLIGSDKRSLEQWSARVGERDSRADAGDDPDPARTIATYQKSLGRTESLDAFLEAARSQSRFDWKPEYTATAVNAYIRAGFGRP